VQVAAAPGAFRAGPSRSVVLTSLGGKAAELAAQLLLITTVPRILGPSDYGVFALALTLVTLGSASLSIGGPMLMSRFVPAAAPAERAALARALAERLGLWRAVEIVALAIVIAALLAGFPGTFPTWVTVLVGVALAIDLLATLAFQVALGLGITRAFSFRFGVQNSMVVCAGVAGHSIAGIDGAVAGIAVASAVSLSWGVAVVGRRLRDAPAGAAIPRRVLRFGAVHAFSNVWVQVLQRGAIVAVAILAGSQAQTGFCALAVGLALAATYVVWQIFTVQLPGLVEGTRGSHDVAPAEAEMRRLARPAVVIALVVALVGVIALDAAVPLVFGDGYDGAQGAVAIALALLPLAPLTGMATQAAALRLRADLRLWSAVIGAVVMLAVCLVFVPSWEAQGGSAALLAGSATMALVSIGTMPRAFDRFLVLVGLGGSLLVLGAGVLTGAL
jgi:O-antigen/teichoic acid export membrane protein